MKRAPLWKISADTTSEGEEAVSEALGQLLATSTNSYTNALTGRITVSAFVESLPASSAGLRREWRRILKHLDTCGIPTGRGNLRLRKLPRENWAESWKRHFRALEIGDALLLKPSWIKRNPKPGQAVIVLDPGLSFGTGQHPTTAFCLRELVRTQGTQRRKSVLDIGTGSGILAIAAAKLGYAPVHAFDLDPDAVRVARANAKTNGVEKRIQFTLADLTKMPAKPPRTYDLVCANLISTLLIAERKRIAARVKSGGMLVVAGILSKEYSEVTSAFESLDLRLIRRRREKEWTSGAFVAPA